MEAVAIVDSGGANIASLRYAFERLGVSARLTCDPREVRDAPRVILPGVGAAGDAMRRLASLGLAELLPRLTQPVLGILWYLGLLVPFVYFAEKLLFCYSDIRRQLAAQAVIFLAVAWS